ncbi:MAG: hypothetical protein NC350_06070, partial [Corallococcus sp.]|nr:hypothetical protein [Corallococcus sp.]
MEFKLVDFDERFMEIAPTSDSLTQKAVAKYKVTILIKNDETNNYAWDDGTASGSLEPLDIEFEIVKKSVALPVVDLDKLVYTGQEIVYEPSGYDSQWMTISGNTGIDANTYTMTLSLVDTANSCWSRAGVDEQPNEQIENMSFVRVDVESGDDIADKQLQWRINKVKLVWSDASGAPKLIVPSEFADVVAVTYKYTDEEGNDVDEASLQNGVKYTVRAEIGSDCFKNFGIGESMLSYGENEFVISGDGFLDFVKDNWLWLVIGLSVLLLFIITLLIVRS